MKPEQTFYGVDPALFIVLSFSAIFLFLLGILGYALYNTIKAERKRKKFTSVMKEGDKVYFPVMSGSVNAEVLEINDDMVKVVVSVRKSRVYPNEENI